MEKKKAPLLMLVKMSFEPRAEERTPISDFVLGVRRNGPVEHSLSVARSLYFSSVVFSPGQVLSLLNNPRVQPVPTLGWSISAIWINSEDIDFFQWEIVDLVRNYEPLFRWVFLFYSPRYQLF